MVCVSVRDISPAHGLIRPRSGAVPTMAFDLRTTAGERLRAVQFSIVARAGVEPRPEHFLPPATSQPDPHRRLRRRSGFAVFHCTSGREFYADCALPSLNDQPVPLDSPEAIDLSLWPRVQIRLPEALTPPAAGRAPAHYCIVLQTSRSAARGMAFAVRLEGLEFDRNTPWLRPTVSRTLRVDAQPPRLKIRLDPGPKVAVGQPVTFRVEADEPLAFAPQWRVLPPGYRPRDLGRGAAMRPGRGGFEAEWLPLALLTSNGAATPTVRYWHDPKPIPRYADDGRCLINADCRYSWLAKGAVTWRNAPRVEITFDLAAEHEVRRVRSYVTNKRSGLLMAVETALARPGPWSRAGRAAAPEFGRGPEFNPPLNVVEAAVAPTRARWVRLRFTGQTSLQVTEVEILGDPAQARTGRYTALFSACDRAGNEPENAKVEFEVTQP